MSWLRWYEGEGDRWGADLLVLGVVAVVLFAISFIDFTKADDCPSVDCVCEQEIP